ncbi:MAG: acyltransferase [Oscillospiraceae bacterium]|nr:acyltransferase [Oscillospiraceae bacterium]
MEARGERTARSAKERLSGVELLKILAMLIIITSHIVQTISTGNGYIEQNFDVLDLNAASSNIQYLALSVMRMGGGSIIFFVCSAWFLLDSKQVKADKVFRMLTEVWFASVAILIIVYAVRDGSIAPKLIKRSLFPTFYNNNWYVTCYILFYLMHTQLNKVIYSLSQPALLKSTLLLAFLYIFVNYIDAEHFFTTSLTLWVAIYFCVAYIKLYMPRVTASRKAGAAFVLVGYGGHCAIIALTNYLGLHIPSLSSKVLHWSSLCSPFLILAAIGLCIIAVSLKFKSRAVNTISGLSLLIYIIHENPLMGTYVRPYIIGIIYEKVGYTHVALWVLALAAVIFLCTAAVSMLYKVCLQKFVYKISDKIYSLLRGIYGKIEPFLLRIK